MKFRRFACGAPRPARDTFPFRDHRTLADAMGLPPERMPSAATSVPCPRLRRALAVLGEGRVRWSGDGHLLIDGHVRSIDDAFGEANHLLMLRDEALISLPGSMA